MAIAKTSRPETADIVLREAQALAQELRPGRQLTVAADSRLDRDLELDSLARGELLLRLEQAFDTQLPEQLLASSETLQDLMDAVDRAQRGGRSEPAPLRPVTRTPTTTQRPERAQTLVEVLEWQAKTQPKRVHAYLLGEGDRELALTYGDLWQGARKVMARLLQRGLMARQTVAIMLPTGRDYLISFFGILLAGGIPVPIYPPARLSQIEDHIRRHVGILANAQATFLITVPEAKPLAFVLRAHVQSMRGVLTPADLRGAESPTTHVVSQPDDIAFLQYTSGSTGNPKGVVLTHANLLANIRAIAEAGRIGADDVYVSWLPLYHDMGLIASWLGSLYFSIPFVLMSPLAFLARPQRWLWAIHRHRGTLSGAPNFAYELCLRKIRDSDIEGLDLSSWRVAYNGAEPVSPDTMERFIARFEPCGFRREAMMAVFGLAECSVGLTCPTPGRGPKVDRIQREPFLTSGRALSAADDDDTALSFPACGWPLPGHEIRIVDAAGFELGERQQGRLEFRGPSATSGYYRNAEQTRRLFHGDWLDSADLAYIADGELHVTGRVKDLIIRAGRNIHPQELELAIGDIEGVRRGCVAVFASTHPQTGTERLVVLAETRVDESTEREALQKAINDCCLRVIDMPADDVVLVAPQTVPKTSSGKIRRAASRDWYEHRGQLKGTAPVWWQLSRLMLAAVVPELRHWWRSGRDVLYSSYAWLVLLPVALVAWPLITLMPRPAWAWRLARGAARLLLRLWGVPWTASGVEQVPAGGHYLVVANHGSYLDGLFLLAAWPEPLHFVAKAELRRQLVAGVFLRRLGTHFVERFDLQQGVADASRLIGAAHTGQRLMLFPEGTFTRAAGLGAFHLGAFMVAAQTATSVLPVALRGPRSVLRGESWLLRRQRVAVDVGAPLAPSGGDWQAALALRDAARADILKRCREPDLSR